MLYIGVVCGVVVNGEVVAGKQASGTGVFHPNAIADYFEAGMFVNLRAAVAAAVAAVVDSGKVAFVRRNADFFFDLVSFPISSD